MLGRHIYKGREATRGDYLARSSVELHLMMRDGVDPDAVATVVFKGAEVDPQLF